MYICGLDRRKLESVCSDSSDLFGCQIERCELVIKYVDKYHDQ